MWSRIVASLNELTIQRLGLVVAAGLLIATWYQGCLTRDALKETQQEFTAHQRPYVSLGRKDGTLAEFVEPKSPKGGRIGLKIYLQNGGQPPALTPNIGILTGMVLGYANGTWDVPYALKIVQPFQPLLRYGDTNGGGGSNGNGSIPPQSEYIAWVNDLLTPEELNSMRVGRRSLELSGRLEYCDEFGRYSCRGFTIFFNGPPINAFSEVGEEDCAMIYFYPPRRSDQTYLPPCEQPAEREQRQAQEQQEIAERAVRAPTATPAPTRTPSPN